VARLGRFLLRDRTATVHAIGSCLRIHLASGLGHKLHVLIEISPQALDPFLSPLVRGVAVALQLPEEKALAKNGLAQPFMR
jgi:hypothetical protein